MPAVEGSAAIGISAAGITLFGVVTGLHPGLLIAGFAGSWAALSYLSAQMSTGQRISSVIVGALGAAWGAPLAVAFASGSAPADVTPGVLQFPIALGLGFLSFTVIAPAVLRIARRRLEREEA